MSGNQASRRQTQDAGKSKNNMSICNKQVLGPLKMVDPNLTLKEGGGGWGGGGGGGGV